MTQETIEKPAEKSMARLAEILRERGVDVQDCDEIGSCESDPEWRMIRFRCSDPYEALQIASYSKKQGYEPDSLVGTWQYPLDERLTSYWELSFRPRD